MSYEFFFSYTRGNYNDYLQRFFDDLCAELREQLGLPRSAVVGFFDQNDIETGTEWEKEIVGALQQSKVMVCIYSPGYFKSEYCGKEWWVFQERRAEYLRLAKAAGEPDPQLPPVIKPVFWLAPLPAATAAAVKASQYLWGDPEAEHNRSGLKYVLQKLQDYQSFYADYIRKLATEIRLAGQEHVVPPLAPVPALSEVPSAWAPPAAAAPGPAPAPAPPAPAAGGASRLVKFIYVAADPAAFAGHRQPEPYHENGGSDWKPFYPPVAKPIGPLAQSIAADDELNFTSEWMTLRDGHNLVEEVQQAYEERKIVVILVDGWSLKCKPQYKNILKHFDENLLPKYINYSVLVPWNEGDPENAGRKEEIDKLVKEALSFRAVHIGNSLFYRDSIDSVKALREALSDVLIKIRAEMHKRVEEVKSVPSTIGKPTVSN